MGIISCEEKCSLERQNQILSLNEADKMVENVIGVFGLPLAIASDFLVNDKNYLLDAMQTIAKTGNGPKDQSASAGCSIKWKK